ncbi:hypothetical protein [Thermohalobacter berrensis]|uniref:Uncharacterized protein n=1 Tax=Thermohalobacter berrensis TaxID=99594 RepID=A0A419T1T4_9FIRM|nr:hypothetical protein [Thermohalobacter berrensis]RKD31388.1 hypothetical protein BET03_12725 [Thermohalobacter berrensis]
MGDKNKIEELLKIWTTYSLNLFGEEDNEIGVTDFKETRNALEKIGITNIFVTNIKGNVVTIKYKHRGNIVLKELEL